ncbi:MAG: alanine racemase [Gammaproteobacteria bacterium]|nr:alanine racemase [Gammaproteobacteria bacterium]
MKRPARVRISLSNLVHNCRQARAQAPHSSLMAVIKADAYGHGALACAQALRGEADAFAVATLDEALELRDGGTQDPVIVMHGAREPVELESAIEQNLCLVVHDSEQIALLEQAQVSGMGPQLWLKVNTGMSRLGINPEQAESCLARLQALPWHPGPVGLMTHLACAGESDDDTTRIQLERFAKISSTGERSAANSAAVLRYPESHLDWTRPGLMLYGVTPDHCPSVGLRPVMTLEAPLLTVRDCQAGNRLGYGATYTCASDMRVGLVEAGYADGYPHASNGQTEVAIGSRRFPTLGRVSMDLIAIDLTDSKATVGDWVELWGSQIPVGEVAGESGTIAYELLARVGHLRHKYGSRQRTSPDLPFPG